MASLDPTMIVLMIVAAIDEEGAGSSCGCGCRSEERRCDDDDDDGGNKLTVRRTDRD
jgi:hypothetical protein